MKGKLHILGIENCVNYQITTSPLVGELLEKSRLENSQWVVYELIYRIVGLANPVIFKLNPTITIKQGVAA